MTKTFFGVKLPVLPSNIKLSVQLTLGGEPFCIGDKAIVRDAVALLSLSLFTASFPLYFIALPRSMLGLCTLELNEDCRFFIVIGVERVGSNFLLSFRGDTSGVPSTV